jgi:hypothetical protein
MAEFLISGVWLDKDDVITHYAFHTVGEKTISRAEKKTKAQAVALLETAGNTAKTRIWDYNKSKFTAGEKVEVVKGANGKYLRSNPDNKLTDNLAHLIDFDWINP